MMRFLGSGFKIGADSKRQEAMRAHMQVCEDCAKHYQDSVDLTASMTGALRSKERRDIQARLRRSKSRPRLGGMGAMGILFAAGRTEPSNRVKRIIWRLRPVLIASFFIFLMTEVTKPSEPGPAFRVKWLGGTLELNGKHLRDNQPNHGLPRGAQCFSFESAGAKIFRAEGSLVMGPDSSILAERVTPARLRLVYGEAELAGTMQLTSTAGELTQVAGLSKVSLVGDVFTVECLEGTLEVISAGVDTVLQPGQVMNLDQRGMPQSMHTKRSP
ncbi:MAG: hypothetical protein ACJAZ8_000772 [Planctomycetota bacterium]|jgi:hypothetical protein